MKKKQPTPNHDNRYSDPRFEPYTSPNKSLKRHSRQLVAFELGEWAGDLLTYLLNYSLPYLHTYLITPWSTVLEKLTGSQLVKKFPTFYGTRRFITALKSARHLSLSSASSIQSMPPHFLYLIIIHLRLGLPIGLFPSGFPNKTLYTPLVYPIRATCPAHLILLDIIIRTIIDEEYR